MTNKELIDQLSELPPHLPVYISTKWSEKHYAEELENVWELSELTQLNSYDEEIEVKIEHILLCV